MSSGCILGDCYICGWQVYEDEIAWTGDNMRHSTCKGSRTLRQENEALRRELEEYKKWKENADFRGHRPQRERIHVREIKFRGKRKDNGEWVYGGYFSQRNINVDFKVYYTHFILLNTEKALDFRWMIEVDPKTVSQFIGFTDKNGRDIYGRDLVEDENGIGEVEWVQEHCSYLVFTRNPSQYHRLESDGKLSRTAVIGNAIDNPELLEV